jgi:hypothetical protein
MVGTSGRLETRLALVMPSARSRPVFRCGNGGSSVDMSICT